jgi:hypothetical protein
MLNKRTANFAELVWSTAAKVGNNAPAITDKIIKRAFPQTYAEAHIEGADKMLRVGVIADVKRILKRGAFDETQIDFSDVAPEFAKIAQALKSKTYFVESANEYVDVPNLIADPALLDDARKFMRRKGEECLAEANTLDELYVAIVGGIQANV